MNNVNRKAEMITTLRALLRQALRLQAEGAGCLSLGRAQGYADGYLRVLLDLGLLDTREALAVVTEERTAHAGPATGRLSEDVSVAA